MECRTMIAVTLMAFLQLFVWFQVLSDLFGLHFWDQKYALDRIRSSPPPPALHNSTVFTDVEESAFSWRYGLILPHVIGAIVWWNTYFFQLIAWLRHHYKAFHRWLGRILLAAATLQVVSGMVLAWTSHTSIFKITTSIAGVVVAYCIVQAARYARARDIARHQFWSVRLVGYLQAIAAQRFWMMILISTHQMGWTFLYPAFHTSHEDDDDVPQDIVDAVVWDIYNGSLVLAVLSATYLTEWYLSGMDGKLDPPCSEHRKLYQEIGTI